MLMTGQLLRPDDSNRATRIVRALARRSGSNQAIRIARALSPIHSPAEKANVRKGNAGKGNPAETDKASRPKQETQRQTPPRVRANNPDPRLRRRLARNLATVALRVLNETTRPAGAEAKD